MFAKFHRRISEKQIIGCSHLHRIRISSLFIAGLFAVLLKMTAGCSPTAPPTGKIQATLNDMIRHGKDFDTEPLHERGVEGLRDVLDVVFWQTPERGGYPGRFVEQYEADASKAAQVSAAFDVYVREIDDEPRLMLLAERVRKSLNEHDLGRVNDRGAIINSSIKALVQPKEDKYVNVLTPLLDHSNERVATEVVRMTRNFADNDFYPELQLNALNSDRDEVVAEAIKWAPNCWDNSRKDDLKKALLDIFENRSDDLKVKAAFALQHDFDHKPAAEYYSKHVNGDSE